MYIASLDSRLNGIKAIGQAADLASWLFWVNWLRNDWFCQIVSGIAINSYE